MRAKWLGFLCIIASVPALAFTQYGPTPAGLSITTLAEQYKPDHVDVFSMEKAIQLRNPNAFLTGSHTYFKPGQQLQIPENAQEVIDTLMGDAITTALKPAGKAPTMPVATTAESKANLDAQLLAAQNETASVVSQLNHAKAQAAEQSNQLLYLQKQIQQLTMQNKQAFWSWLWFLVWVATLVCWIVFRCAPNARPIATIRHLMQKHHWQTLSFKLHYAIKHFSRQCLKKCVLKNVNPVKDASLQEQGELAIDEVAASADMAAPSEQVKLGDEIQFSGMKKNTQQIDLMQEAAAIPSVTRKSKLSDSCLPHKKAQQHNNTQRQDEHPQEKLDPQEAVLREYIQASPKDLTHHKALLNFYDEQDNQAAFDRHLQKMLAKKVITEGSPQWHELRTQYLDRWVYSDQ